KVFTQGLSHVVGHTLPIMKNVRGEWQTGPWFLRAERCYLFPGDSPMGYRLPIDSQPWTAQSDYPYVNPPDAETATDPLASYSALRSRVGGARGAAEPRQQARRTSAAGRGGPDGRSHPWNKPTDTPPGFQESAGWITRLAMCAEPRAGRLYIFMPPTQALDDYLEIVAAVEATAEEMNLPVILEGYEPPADPRLTHFRVTPDPGVIEVNIHPARNWAQLVEQTTHLYEAAHQSRLTTEKFMVDGRHTGTGGGNHFVLGGATPNDSPFLRRPDLLQSLIAYWHNHPSLSYLFSGLFIGPTSQAPRVDEARNDSLYELEIAFKQIPPAGSPVPPWLIDRILRNLLTDVTGNTHRAEFCIDKLYSPDGPTGRLGLLELRAFEMPPHARMSLAQQLLLRALIARFWEAPYAPSRLTRWGTELHDRFMLPFFAEQDFRDVIEEMNQAGYPFKLEWFAPHFEFRFPKYGDFAVKGIEFELRHALEPWHVMGEEGGAGSTVRYVDSSVERVQVKVRGMAPDRYVLTCNGVPVPLQNTGSNGEFVAGVRYRAWQPAACLHPTIGVQAPLVFDLVDTWMQRSLGGCQYHVAHPGGRSFETFPVNAFEAESRRLARFFRFGHTPGTVRTAAPVVSAEHPFTLDLRRF
ncbi:MAG TPA: transglutaminase family protein, partial [Azonexus sp.]